MRILTISGQNIASLGQPFCIDFTAPPLAGAGLFAITGETGAGKSSILDAMCLALYGDAPRLSGGAAADEVPDPSGEAIKAKDSRAILRRGAIQGWAEVSFTARDGQDYTARWQARRARDKADGKLQSVARSLSRASDGQVLASQTTAVSAQIETLTGFSYEEFRRTVLLAQGDFDAFLRADTNDRAGLLEKVTGTGLYRAVSVRVYERTDTARQAHDALAQQRAGHHLLSVEDHALMGEERLALTRDNLDAAAQAKTAKDGLDRHKRHADAARQLALAQATLDAALAEQSKATDARMQLARIDRAAPLRAPWQASQSAAGRLDDAAQAVGTTGALAAQTSETAANLKILATKAEDAAIAQEAIYKGFNHVWDKAAELDAHIATAVSEVTKAQDTARALAQSATEARDVLTGLHAEEKGHRDTADAAQSALARLAADSALADGWPQIAPRIAEHAEARQAQSTAEAEAKKHGDTLTRLDGELAELARRNETDRAAEAALADDINTLTDAIARTESDHPPTRGGELASLAASLSAMVQTAADHATARSERGDAQATGEAAAKDALAAQAQIAAAAVALGQAEAQVVALTAPTERAGLAASESARELRLRLEPGAACPVCGSLDHPAHADAVLADLAAQLRNDLASARRVALAAHTDQANAMRAQDRAQGQAEQARLAAAKSDDRMSNALALWQSARDKAQASQHCPELPTAPGDASERLTVIVADIATAQTSEVAAQANLTRLRADLSAMGTRREALRTAVSNHAGTRDNLSLARAEASNLSALALRDAAAAQDLAARHRCALAPILQQLQEGEEALNDPDLADRLAARVAAVVQHRAARDGAACALAALAPRIASAMSRNESACAQVQQAKGIVETRAKALADLRDERAPLLDGEATAVHRTRHNDARKAAASEQDAARNAHGAAASAAAAANARAEAALAEQVVARLAVTTTSSALDTALAASDLARADLDGLFARPVATVEAMRQDLRALDDAVTSAHANVTSRTQDQADTRAAGLPEETAEALADILTTLETACATRDQRIGAIDADIQRDTTTRASLAGLEADIATARAELDVWQAVHHAIGSRNGDKFARVAQSITLDVLVDHANGHLADLNPRYCLRRGEGLALQVEDRDMGNEARATRSLSGGERFLVSLALALALSRMGGKGGLVATLFIDEGFGSLDAASLDLAIDALEGLQSQGRQVGVISHVEAMKDRIPTRIAVRKQGGGKSVVEVEGMVAPLVVATGV